MTRQITNVCSRLQVYQIRDRWDALLSIDHALREIQRRDRSGVDSELLDQIINALESAEQALLSL
jgi:hypothetical protein